MIGISDKDDKPPRHRISSSESNDSDHLRQNIYEDYDELADLAITSSEPPPPGTGTLQEELISLITDNNAPGVSINKKEVASWLKDEDAMLINTRQRSGTISSLASDISR